MERTFVILKPDTVKRKLAGEIISRFEKKNLEITRLQMTTISREKAEEHYAHIRQKPRYDELIDFMTDAPMILMILEGENVIQVVRGMLGKTNSFEALPGTIRGDYGLHLFENLVHASDTPETVEIEIKRFFG